MASNMLKAILSTNLRLSRKSGSGTIESGKATLCSTTRSFRDFYVGHGGPCCTNFCHFYFIFIFSAEWNSAMRTFENGQRKCHFFPINKVELYSQFQLLFPRDLCFVAGKDVLFTLLDNFDECKCICVLFFDKSIEILNSLLFGL